MEDLDRLYRFDLEIQEEAEHIAGLIGALMDSEDLAAACSRVIDVLSALSERIERRDSLIGEVA